MGDYLVYALLVDFSRFSQILWAIHAFYSNHWHKFFLFHDFVNLHKLRRWWLKLLASAVFFQNRTKKKNFSRLTFPMWCFEAICPPKRWNLLHCHKNLLEKWEDTEKQCSNPYGVFAELCSFSDHQRPVLNRIRW